MRVLRCAAMMSAVALSTGHADNLLENGSFELPAVNGRMPVTDGGDPAKVKPTGWDQLKVIPGAAGGKLVAGLTNEIARTGKQSLFVDFEKLTAPSRQISLVTNLIPVKPSQSYRVSIWGRIDGKRPLTLDERRPYVWIDVQFLKADRETEAGEAQLGVQMIPGSIVPGDINDLVFVSWKWSQSVAVVETPKDTAFLQVTWTWGVPRDEGETDGVVFWDDAGIEENTPPPTGNPKKEAPSAAPGEQAPGATGKAPAAVK